MRERLIISLSATKLLIDILTLPFFEFFVFFLFFGCECFAMLIFFFWVHLFLNANFGMHNELNCVVCKRKIFVFDIGFDIE